MTTGSPAASVTETIDRVFQPIHQFTRGWMMTPETAAHGVDLGLRDGQHFWLVGRAGVLGSATSEIAVGALAFHGAEAVHDAWTNLPSGLSHYEVAEHYLSRVVAWGDAALASFDDDRLERIDRLGRAIIDAAPVSLGALFAGWRAMPQPDGVGARVALTTHVLREMRGAAHINAILASGLTPLDAILASTGAPPRTGPEWAERMGFVGPFRDPDEVRDQRLEAERITVRILEPYFGVLSPEELGDFGELVESTRNAIDM